MKKIVTKTGIYKGKPAIFLNDTAVPPQYYALTDCPTGNKSYETIPSVCIREFSDIGFRLFQADVWLEDMLSPDGAFDITFARKQIAGFTSICPDAAVMLRLHLNPPSWWLNAHPEECVRYLDCDTLPIPRRPAHERYLEYDLLNYLRVSYASEKWLSETPVLLKRFISLIRETPEWDNLSAIQIANGIYGENHYWGFLKHEPDMSEPMLRYFRKFLKAKYGTDEKLREAWNDETVSFDTASLPGTERLTTSCGILRDPVRERRTVDYYEAQHRTVADSIILYCSVIKETAPELITGAFYGYYLSVFGRQAAGGHLCEDIVLNSPYVDFLAAPQAYGKANREIGGPGLSRGLIESVTLHGKVWLSEMDQPSHFGTCLGGLDSYNKPDSIQNNRKCVLEPFIRGGGMWYYDFGKLYSAGWWDDDDFLADIASIKKVYDDYFEKERIDEAEVLLVLDTKTFFYTAIKSSLDPITDNMMNMTVVGSYKSGAAVSTVYLSDIEKVDLKNYRCVFFVNCYCVTDEKLAFIRNNVMKDGRCVVFSGPFAAIDGETLDFNRVENSTGIRLEASERKMIPEVEYHGSFKVKESENIPEKREFGSSVFMNISDAGAICIGSFGDGAKAAGYVQSDNGKTFYFSVPPTSPATLNALYESCGCHIYSKSHDSVLIGQGLIEIHTSDGGEKAIQLKNGKTVSFKLNHAETAVFDSESGARIL